jgi:hypothetical protein
MSVVISLALGFRGDSIKFKVVSASLIPAWTCNPRDSVREVCVSGGAAEATKPCSHLEECFEYSQRLLQLIGVQPRKQALDLGHQEMIVNFLCFVFKKG